METKERQLNKLLKHFHPGNVIFEEGEFSNELYILKTGKVAIMKEGEKIAVVSEAGSYLGEMSALLDEPRSATLVAETFCQFYVVPGNRLFKLVLDHPTIGIKLLGMLADRLRNTTNALARSEKECLSIKEKYDRLKSHYSGITFLAAKINRVIRDPNVKMLVEYAWRKYPIARVNRSFYDKTIFPDELKRFFD